MTNEEKIYDWFNKETEKIALKYDSNSVGKQLDGEYIQSYEYKELKKLFHNKIKKIKKQSIDK